MRVKIDEIRGGKRLTESVSRDRLTDLLQEVSAHQRAQGDAALELDLTLDGRRVIVQGRMTLPLVGACRRCLTGVESNETVDFVLTLIPADQAKVPGLEGEDHGDVGEGESAGSFRLEEADEDVYEGVEIDLWPLIREQILLALDENVVCKEDCKGLCVVCGADLNAAECGCDRAVPDPRLAALAKIKLS